MPKVPGSSSGGGGGVPARLFVRAMTSLPPHYRDDHGALEDHLREEHAVFAASEAEAEAESAAGSGTGTRRAHLCCTDYKDGPSLKSALEAAAGGKGFVRTALNSNGGGGGGGYCAVAHVSSAVAARTAAADRIGVSCSPLTHASKEPLSLLAPTPESSSSRGGAPASPFGLRLGPAVQDGPSRGVVVTLSPGSLPLDTAAAAAAASGKGNTRGSGGNRSLSSSSPSSSSPAELERTWRAFWGGARGSEGAGVLASTVPWTGSRPPRTAGGGGVDDGDARRSLLTAFDGAPGASPEGRSGGSRSSGAGSVSRARQFHGQKVAGYKAALEHLGDKMENGGVGGAAIHGAATLAETCGWDSNLAFVHGRDDLLYLRCASERVRFGSGLFDISSFFVL